ncbi:MAG: FAD-binding oxidoreductase [Chitinophagales bacterium]|nr:FAD-binding oxidoreductase [Chitinophagales bacterium]
MIIKSEDLQINEHISSQVNITPLGNNQYYIGSTYDWDDDKFLPTKNKYNYLKDALDKTINVPYKILEIKAGIRPTVKDRRPLLGVHPKHPNMYVFNGFGTKGLSLGPYFADEFVQFLLGEKELDKEYNITRFQ